jgi:hypothetical protein
MKPLPLVLSLVSGLCFVSAFLKPLVCSDFSLRDVPHADQPEEWIDDPCEKATDAIKDWVEDGLTESEYAVWVPDAAISLVLESDFWKERNGQLCRTLGLEEKARDHIYSKMDEHLGQVRDPRNGDDLSWEDCMEEVEDGADSKDLGSCCSNEDDAFQTCTKWWVVDKGGIPIGDQYLLEIIQRLFKTKDVPLGLMIVLFSICFPLLKVGLSLYLSIRPITERTIRFLSITSKWSMTDVFLVALLITFFKADAFHFRFEAGTGLYLFAAGALLSSVTVMLLERASNRPSPAPTEVE